MDANESNNGSRSALRQPFIDTANALAYFYKQAVSTEREAVESGSRATYMRIMEWVARKSRAGERVSPAEVINFCASEMAKIPAQAQVMVAAPAAVERQIVTHNQPETLPVVAVQPQGEVQPGLDVASGRVQGSSQPVSATLSNSPHCAQPAAYIPRDDGLVSDIRKLHVNPRKRQRVDISDAFIRACRNASNDSGIFAPDNGCSLRSNDTPPGSQLVSIDPSVSPGLSNVARRESKDSKDGRDPHFIAAIPSEYPSRKGRNAKAHLYEKFRRK